MTDTTNTPTSIDNEALKKENFTKEKNLLAKELMANRIANFDSTINT